MNRAHVRRRTIRTAPSTGRSPVSLTPSPRASLCLETQRHQNYNGYHPNQLAATNIKATPSPSAKRISLAESSDDGWNFLAIK